jgi:hypothetical protein
MMRSKNSTTRGLNRNRRRTEMDHTANSVDHQARRLGANVDRIDGWTTIRAGNYTSTFPQRRDQEIARALAGLPDDAEPRAVAMTCTRARFTDEPAP